MRSDAVVRDGEPVHRKAKSLRDLVANALRDAQHTRRAPQGDLHQAVEAPRDERRVELRMREVAEAMHREHEVLREKRRRGERAVKKIDSVADEQRR